VAGGEMTHPRSKGLTYATESVPLRALKKQRTAQALRATARDYFKRVHFDHAKLTDIARDAEVSATTVYNYYPTKLALLYAVAGEENLEVVAKARKLTARQWTDAVEAIHAYAKLLFRWFDSFHRSALQAILASSLAPHTEAHTHYARIDELEAVALNELVVVLQEQRLIDSGIDAGFLGGLLFSVINAEFVNFVSDDSRTVEVSCVLLRRQLEFLSPAWAVRRTRTKIPH
jgi:AcrR family transcriptional regulator